MTGVALFNFRKRDPLEQLKTLSWASVEERDELIESCLGDATGTRNINVVVELMFVSDGLVQRAALRRVRALQDVGAVDAFLNQIQGKPAKKN